jgi:hypothetical protein
VHGYCASCPDCEGAHPVQLEYALFGALAFSCSCSLSLSLSSTLSLSPKDIRWQVVLYACLEAALVYDQPGCCICMPCLWHEDLRVLSGAAVGSKNATGLTALCGTHLCTALKHDTCVRELETLLCKPSLRSRLYPAFVLRVPSSVIMHVGPEHCLRCRLAWSQYACCFAMWTARGVV